MKLKKYLLMALLVFIAIPSFADRKEDLMMMLEGYVVDTQTAHTTFLWNPSTLEREGKYVKFWAALLGKDLSLELMEVVADCTNFNAGALQTVKYPPGAIEPIIINQPNRLPNVPNSSGNRIVKAACERK